MQSFGGFVKFGSFVKKVVQLVFALVILLLAACAPSYSDSYSENLLVNSHTDILTNDHTNNHVGLQVCELPPETSFVGSYVDLSSTNADEIIVRYSNRNLKAQVSDYTRILDAYGKAISLVSLPIGSELSIQGLLIGNNIVSASEIRQLN